MLMRAIAGWALAGAKDLCLRVPRRLTEVRFHHLLDGGTTGIVGRDEHGHRRGVWLMQASFPADLPFCRPGRMYLGRRLVPMRGGTEAALLVLVEGLLREIEAAGPRPGPYSMFDADVYALRRWLDYVWSDRYGRLELDEPDRPDDEDDG